MTITEKIFDKFAGRIVQNPNSDGRRHIRSLTPSTPKTTMKNKSAIDPKEDLF